LVERGTPVRVLDSLDPQVHGSDATEPALIADHVAADLVEFVRGDVCDAGAVEAALDGVDTVFHQAAAVGVGQSMYRIADYVRANTLGAAVLLEAMVARKDAIRRAVVASSMSIYGEGAYRCPEHGDVAPELRTDRRLATGDYEMHCAVCEAPIWYTRVIDNAGTPMLAYHCWNGHYERLDPQVLEIYNRGGDLSQEDIKRILPFVRFIRLDD